METRHAAVVSCAAGGLGVREADRGSAPVPAAPGSDGHGAGAPAGLARRRAAGEAGAPAPCGAGLDRSIAHTVRERVGAGAFQRYFGRAVGMRYTPRGGGDAGLNDAAGRLEVAVPSRFMAGLLERRFGAALREVAEAETGEGPVGVVFVVVGEEPGAVGGEHGGVRETDLSSARPVQVQPDAAADRTHRRPGAGPIAGRTGRRYRLEDYVVGASNRLAYEAALRLTEEATGTKPAGPLFIHGPCGVGKTHLLQGVAARFKERHPGSVVRSITGEAFTNQFIAAVRAGKVDRFRDLYRRVDLLCLDDVHFLSSKQATQAELLHTFDAIDLGGARVVLASDEHPRQIRQFSEALTSRFLCGMVARLDPPDAELCERIVTRLAAARGLILDPAAARAIGRRAAGMGMGRTAGVGAAAGVDGAARTAVGGGKASVRDLEGMLTTLEAVHRLLPPCDGAGHPERIGLLTVERAFRGAGGGADGNDESGRFGGVRRPIRIERIIADVCRVLEVEPGDLAGRGRHRRVVLARSMVSYLCRTLTTLSFPEIARGLGRPNHSTVITAYQRFKRQLEAGDPADLDTTRGTPLATLCDGITHGLVVSNGVAPR